MKWIRIGAVEEQAITAVYEFLSGLCGEYSNFREWYYGKVIPGLASAERLIYVVMDNETIAAVLILKNSDEKKIGAYGIAQRGGKGNALGRIIFRFDNNFSLHQSHYIS